MSDLAPGGLVLPAGSVIQGLGNEPHYGRAIGETIFDVYVPCRENAGKQ